MTIRSIYINSQDRTRLKELVRDYETQMSQLSEEQLDDEEEKLQAHIRLLLPRTQPGGKLKRMRAMRWGFGFSVAAVSLFLLQPLDSTHRFQTKGLSSLEERVCELQLTSDDRSTVTEDADGFLLPTRQAVYVQIRCMREKFIQAIVKHPDKKPLVLAHNQKMISGFNFLSYGSQVQDIRNYRGGEIWIRVSDDLVDRPADSISQNKVSGTDQVYVFHLK